MLNCVKLISLVATITKIVVIESYFTTSENVSLKFIPCYSKCPFATTLALYLAISLLVLILNKTTTCTLTLPSFLMKDQLKSNCDYGKETCTHPPWQVPIHLLLANYHFQIIF
jgi:hypothetical protein